MLGHGASPAAPHFPVSHLGEGRPLLRPRTPTAAAGVLVRTRGSSDHVFLDLHVWLPPDMHLQDAHALSHAVKDRLMARYPQIADAIIHIEPPPEGRTS